MCDLWPLFIYKTRTPDLPSVPPPPRLQVGAGSVLGNTVTCDTPDPWAGIQVKVSTSKSALNTGCLTWWCYNLHYLNSLKVIAPLPASRGVLDHPLFVQAFASLSVMPNLAKPRLCCDSPSVPGRCLTDDHEGLPSIQFSYVYGALVIMGVF